MSEPPLSPLMSKRLTAVDLSHTAWELPREYLSVLHATELKGNLEFFDHVNEALNDGPTSFFIITPPSAIIHWHHHPIQTRSFARNYTYSIAR